MTPLPDLSHSPHCKCYFCHSSHHFRCRNDVYLHALFCTHRVLYGNQIKDLPSGVFKGLTSLQLLLLNANEIECIRRDAFRDLHSLSLLSLYDNNLQSLANGTFEQLKAIQTL